MKEKRIFLFILLISEIYLIIPKEIYLPPEEFFKTLPLLLKNQIYVGYNKKLVDPKESPVPLTGYGTPSTRQAEVNNQPYKQSLYATTIVLVDEKWEIQIFITVDFLKAETFPSMVKQNLEKKLGLKNYHLTISGTHNHSAPDLYYNIPTMITYQKEVVELMTDSIIEAFYDILPAYGYIGISNVSLKDGKNALNFVRNYWTNDRDIFGRVIASCTNHGFYAWNGKNYGVATPLEHTSKADNEMQMLKFEFGLFQKKDILIVNFRSHVTISGCGNCLTITADWVGVFRDIIEKEKNCRVAYFSGASGNVVSETRLKNGEGIEGISANLTNDPTKTEDENNYIRSQAFGKKLSEYALKKYNDLSLAKLGPIKYNSSTVKLHLQTFSKNAILSAKFYAKIRSSSINDVKNMLCGNYDWGPNYVFPPLFDKTGTKFREIVDHTVFLSNHIKYKVENDKCTCTAFPTDKINLFAEFVGLELRDSIYGSIHSDRIIAHENFTENDLREVVLDTTIIGEIGFATAPYEMSHENAFYVKSKSNTKMTFVFTYAGRDAYIPTAESFDYGSYESDTSKYAKGSGEILADEFVKLINEQYKLNSDGKYINSSLNILFIFSSILVLFI